MKKWKSQKSVRVFAILREKKKIILNCFNFQHTSCEIDTTEAQTCKKTWTKWGEVEGVYIHFPHVDHTRWHRGPSLCFWDPGLVIEQYALLCATSAHPPHALHVFYLPFYKRRGPANSHLHTSFSSSTQWARAPLHLLYHTQTRRKKMGMLLSFPLTAMRKNIKRAWSTTHWALGVKEEKAQAAVKLLALKCL